MATALPGAPCCTRPALFCSSYLSTSCEFFISESTENTAARGTPSCLACLGLDEQADARAIRRAYAARLKRIDQTLEASTFQALRTAYEEALQWAGQQDGQRGRDDAKAQAPELHEAAELASNIPLPDTTDVASSLARAATVRMRAASATLAASAQRYHEEEWCALLEESLAHADLLNLEARVLFESAIAAQLAAGWQSGHETLFAAASIVFGWLDSPSRLARHGAAGMILAQALAEHGRFRYQPAPVRGAQERVIERLRRSGPPDSAQLFRSMRAFEQLLARFPAWTGVTLDPAKIAQWRMLYRQHNGVTFVLDSDDSAQPPGRRSLSSDGPFSPMDMVRAVLLILYLLWRLADAIF